MSFLKLWSRSTEYIDGVPRLNLRYQMSSAAKIDPDTLEMTINLITKHKRLGHNDREIQVKLKENHDYYDWYEGPKTESEYHWPRLVQSLKHKDNPWADEMISSLDQASTTVVGHLAPPDSEKASSPKRLVLGDIQSSKTASFSATIAKTVDEGYKLIIVLVGMHNNLRKQTEIRRREDLIDPTSGKSCSTLTSDDETKDFKKRPSITANRTRVRKGSFTLAVIKKNSSVLRNFKRLAT